MRRALFFILPFPSHYIAVFGFAKQIEKLGLKPIFVGTSNLRELIENEGFEFYTYNYFSEYIISSFKSFLGIFIKTLLYKNFTKKRFREFYINELQIKEIIQKHSISSVYIDEHLAEFYFFFLKHNIEATIINTKLSTKKARNIPPLNVDFVPKNNLFSYILCELFWFRETSKLKLKDFILKLAFGGKDEIFFWKRFCIKNGIYWHNEIAIDHCFYKSIRTINTIILAPIELEFKSRMLHENENYFHVKMLKNEEKFKTKQYSDLISLIIAKNNVIPNFKIVYIAFGTISQNYNKQIYDFLEMLIQLFQNEKNYFFLVSKGNSNYILPDNSNFKFLNFVPQLDFLKYTHLMISHGGLSSIKECYDSNVPIIIIPINKYTDQKGNGARVKSNGLGKSININNISSEEIKFEIINSCT